MSCCSLIGCFHVVLFFDWLKVSMSGLFCMTTMMSNIAVKYPLSYDLANTKMTLHNYNKFRVLETLSCAAKSGVCSGVCRGVCDRTQEWPSSVPSDPRDRAFPGGGSGRHRAIVRAATSWEMAALRDCVAFHEMFTLPFTGDKGVAEYYSRIDRMAAECLPKVTVPLLALLARDDPLSSPMSWERALASIMESASVVVAITERGGHCGWFQDFTSTSWLDKVAGEFLSAALAEDSDHSPLTTADLAPICPSESGGSGGVGGFEAPLR
ncbi:unnamed protein product [Discosporangium mesarthrocarpum]